MNFFEKLFAKSGKVVPAAAGMKAQPLDVTQYVGPASDGQSAVSVDKIEHARYRLDAIRRTLEQSGDSLTAQHKGEFRTEVRDHVHTLIQAGLMTDEDGAALVKTGGA